MKVTKRQLQETRKFCGIIVSCALNLALVEVMSLLIMLC